MQQKKIHKKRVSRSNRVHYQSKLRSNGRFRVSVFKSLNNIYAQVIDDSEGKTLASSSTLVLDKKTGNKKDLAKQVGVDLAQKVQSAGIKEVCFDRGRFLYHGRIAALADGLREGGLQV